MRITATPGAPTPPTSADLIAARDRYEARIPAQAARVLAAERAVAKAQASLDAARAEWVEADAAQSRLTQYLADLTAQIGV